MNAAADVMGGVQAGHSGLASNMVRRQGAAAAMTKRIGRYATQPCSFNVHKSARNGRDGVFERDGNLAVDVVHAVHIGFG